MSAEKRIFKLVNLDVGILCIDGQITRKLAW